MSRARVAAVLVKLIWSCSPRWRRNRIMMGIFPPFRVAGGGDPQDQRQQREIEGDNQSGHAHQGGRRVGQADATAGAGQAGGPVAGGREGYRGDGQYRARQRRRRVRSDQDGHAQGGLDGRDDGAPATADDRHEGSGDDQAGPHKQACGPHARAIGGA